MGDKKKDVLDELIAQKEKLDGMIRDMQASREPGAVDGAVQAQGGIMGAMDLSDPVKEVYLELLRTGEQSAEEMRESSRIEDKDSVLIYLRILAKQGYAEKFKDGDVVKYRAVTSRAGRKKISDDIWDALK